MWPGYVADPSQIGQPKNDVLIGHSNRHAWSAVAIGEVTFALDDPDDPAQLQSLQVSTHRSILSCVVPNCYNAATFEAPLSQATFTAPPLGVTGRPALAVSMNSISLEVADEPVSM